MVLMQDYSDKELIIPRRSNKGASVEWIQFYPSKKDLIKNLLRQLMSENSIKEQKKYSKFVKEIIFERTLLTTLLGL